MPRITEIKPQKIKGRFNIYLDGKYAFALSAIALAKGGLSIDQEITSDQVDKFIKDDDYVKNYDKALKFISYRPRAEKELTDWFKRKEIGDATQRIILRKLKEIGLIDDLEFSKWWIEQRKISRPGSKKLLKLELFNKGINRQIVDDLLSLEEPDSELEAARKIVQKKTRILNDPDAKKMLTGILLRRGFSWEVIKRIIDETFKKE